MFGHLHCFICGKIVWFWQRGINRVHAICDYNVFCKSTQKLVDEGVMIKKWIEYQNAM